MLERLRGNLRVSLFRAMIADACHAVGDAAAGLAEIDESTIALRCLSEFGWHAYALIVRAATGLARLRRTQGKLIEARDLQVPTYCWFTEGFDTLNLREAKALLDELHA